MFGRRLGEAPPVYVAVNRGASPARATIPSGAGIVAGWRDILNDREVVVRDGAIEFEVEARAAAIVAVGSR